MAGKVEIVNHVVDNVEGLTKKQATEAFDAIFDAISDYLADEERVSIHAFGSFSVSHRKARQGRNPMTGAAIQIPASNSVKFKVAKDLKEAVNS